MISPSTSPALSTGLPYGGTDFSQASAHFICLEATVLQLTLFILLSGPNVLREIIFIIIIIIIIMHMHIMEEFPSAMLSKRNGTQREHAEQSHICQVQNQQT